MLNSFHLFAGEFLTRIRVKHSDMYDLQREMHSDLIGSNIIHQFNI